MKKFFVLVALGGMGAFSAGCGESAPAPATAPPAGGPNSPAHAAHMQMMHGGKAAHAASGENKEGDKKDDAAPSDEAPSDEAPAKDKKEGE